jgi:hypothetical protein
MAPLEYLPDVYRFKNQVSGLKGPGIIPSIVEFTPIVWQRLIDYQNQNQKVLRFKCCICKGVAVQVHPWT